MNKDKFNKVISPVITIIRTKNTPEEKEDFKKLFKQAETDKFPTKTNKNKLK